MKVLQTGGRRGRLVIIAGLICGYGVAAEPHVTATDDPSRRLSAMTAWGEPDLRGTYAAIETGCDTCSDNALFRISQSPGFVVIHRCADRVAIVIPVQRPGHPARDATRFLSSPNGRWSGSSLVIRSSAGADFLPPIGP
jgi:hypothetical protein